LVVKDKYAYFYGTLKIHKSPATTWPFLGHNNNSIQETSPLFAKKLTSTTI
jgi:hypothetical protein